MKLFIKLTLLSTILFGCEKFLDKNPDPTKIVPSSLEQIDQLINSGIIYLDNSFDGGADEFFIHEFNPLRNEGLKEYYKTWNSINIDYINQLISQEPSNLNYMGIQIANACLDLLNKIPATSANQLQYNKVKAKCHYIRANNYMLLAWTYCNAYNVTTASQELGMPIDEDVNFKNALKRSSLEELYNYILNEASLAYSLFEVKYPLENELTKINAMGLLARIHLSMRQYDLALKYSNELLTHKSALLNYDNTAEVDISKEVPFKNHNVELLQVILRGAQTINDIVLSTYRDFQIDTNLIASYAENDLRLPAYFKKSGDYYTQKRGTLYGYNLNAPSNLVMMTDEFYLISAECYARENDIQNSMRLLNNLLTKRFTTGTYIPFSPTTKEEALDIVLEERKKSLVLRGLRWIDIKRLNLEGRNISVVRKVEGVTYTLPPNDPKFAKQLLTKYVLEYGYEQNPY